MKSVYLIALVCLTVTIYCVGCTNSTTPTANSNSGTQSTQTASTPLPATSPSQVIKASCEAQKRNDVAAYKKALSKYDLDETEKTARINNMTLDEFIANEFRNPIISGMGPCEGLTITDEQVNGNKATLKVQNSMGRSLKYYFVIEDNQWKISTKDLPEMTLEERERLDQERLDAAERVREKKRIP